MAGTQTLHRCAGEHQGSWAGPGHGWREGKEINPHLLGSAASPPELQCFLLRFGNPIAQYCKKNAIKYFIASCH